MDDQKPLGQRSHVKKQMADPSSEKADPYNWAS